MSALRHYRDDGPLVELAARRLRPAPTALPWTTGALLPLLAVLLAPAPWAAPALTGAVLVAAVLSGPAFTSPCTGRLDWLVPPLLRLAEYAALLRLAVLDGPGAVPACYALLAALAYHHYDVVYRLRDRGELPPPWLRRAGLGWDGRLAVAGLLAVAGVLRPALYLAAGVLLVVYVVESAAAWRRSEGVAT